MPLTTIYQLKTFADIYNAVREELKIQSSDTTAIQRIKRDINIVYLEEVVPNEPWKWLRGTFDATVYAAITSGTASVTQGNNTVTLTTPVVSPKQGWLFGIVGYNEVYRIAQHDPNSNKLILQVPYTGTTNTAATYKLWTDEIYLPSFVRETFEISHDFQDQPLENCGLQQFRQFVAGLPRAEGRPLFYTTNTYSDPNEYLAPSGLPASVSRSSNILNKTLTFASDVSNYLQQGDRIEIAGANDPSYNGRFVVASQSGTTITYTAVVPTYETTLSDTGFILRKLQPASDSRRAKRVQIYPAIYNQNTTLHIDFIREATPLADDSDEPLMPIGDRTVLLYGGLHRAWSRERNPEEAKRNFDLFTAKLIKMTGYLDDSIDQPKLIPSKIYLGSKRNSTRQKSTQSGLPEGIGGGSSGGQVITNTANRAAIFDSTGSLNASAVLTGELSELSGIGSKAVGISDTQTLTNKTLLDTSTSIASAANATKFAKFSLGGATAGTTTTLLFISTASRNITFPDASDTLVTLSSAQTLSNKTLNGAVINGSQLNSSSAASLSGTLNSTIQVVNPASGAGQAWNFTNATSNAIATLTFIQSAARNYTFPDTTDTLVTSSATQTFFNKTFSTGNNKLLSSTATIGQYLVADGSGNANWQTVSNLTNPMTTFGDIIYESSSATPVRLAGTTSTAIKYLTQTGNGTISAAPVWSGFKAITIQSFSSTGTATYTTPTSPAPLYVKITVIGAGGGGGSNNGLFGNGGGGGGGTSILYAAASVLGVSKTVTIGAGGVSGNSGTGGAGGTSSFGSLASATGGAGGLAGTGTTSGAGGLGGIGSIGTINFSGNDGESGGAGISSVAEGPGGNGGGSFMGGGGAGASAQNSGGTAGNNGYAFGGGGGGAGGGFTGAGGGVGGNGFVTIEEYYQ